jgi:ABC-type glycerol-3-phosphate transport system substrate-binding protein
MKRFILIIILLMCFSTACFYALAGGSKEEEDVVKIAFLSHTYEPWNNKLQEQANTFMELNPNVEIEYSYVMHADLFSKLISSLEAGTAANVIGVFGPWMPKLVNGDFLAPASSVVAQDIKNNYADFGIDAVTYNNKIYGHIQHVGMVAPVVNPDLFEELGEEIPDTWSGFVKLADKYSYMEDMVITALEPAGDSLVLQWATVLRSFGGEMLTKDLKKAAFNSPEGLAATKAYVKLANPAFIGTDEVSAFILGKAGLVLDGSWARTFYEESTVLKHFYTTIPPREKFRRIASYVWLWVVNADASEAQKHASWDFVQFLSNDENYLDMAKTIGFVPFRKSNIKDLSDDQWVKGFADSTEYAFIYYERIENWEEVETVLRRELERAIADEITVEKALINAEVNMNKLLK